MNLLQVAGLFVSVYLQIFHIYSAEFTQEHISLVVICLVFIKLYCYYCFQPVHTCTHWPGVAWKSTSFFSMINKVFWYWYFLRLYIHSSSGRLQTTSVWPYWHQRSPLRLQVPGDRNHLYLCVGRGHQEVHSLCIQFLFKEILQADQRTLYKYRVSWTTVRRKSMQPAAYFLTALYTIHHIILHPGGNNSLPVASAIQ